MFKIFTKKDRKIANQKAMIENRDKLIKDLQARNEMSSKSNAGLRHANSEQTELLKQIAELSVTYPVDRSKECLDKIKELTRDYQSEN